MLLTSKNFMLLLILTVALIGSPFSSKTAALTETVIKIEPALNEFSNSNGDPIPIPGTQFNITVKIYNVTNLYGFDLKFRWNTTFLKYVSHSVSVPRDTYVDGVLWNPILQLADEVNTTGGTYWISYASMAPAPSFNGTATVFTMTFEVIKQPYDYETGGPEINPVDTVLDFSSTDLAPRVSEGPVVPITHSVEPATVRIWEKRFQLPAYPILRVMPTKVGNFSKNSIFNMSIWIVGVDPQYDIQSFNITLGFNSTLIEATSIAEGPWLKSYAENTTETTRKMDNDKGTATYALEQVPPTTHPPPTISGILFTITFLVTYESLEYPPPLCNLALEPTEIHDRSIGALAHTTENSTYTAYRPSPVAKFTWSPSGSMLPLAQNVTFNASESYHPLGGKIALYTWDFGDDARETRTDPIITHTYTQTGNHRVVLNVTDYGGFSDYTSVTLYIIEAKPKPYLVVDPSVIKLGPYPPQVVGQQFNISIYVKNLDTTWSLQEIRFFLTYNVTLIDVIGDLANITIPDLWRGPNEVTIARQSGVTGTVTLTVVDPSVTPSGDELAATIQFTVVHQGIYPSVDTGLLTLGGIELKGAAGEIAFEPPIQGQIAIKGLSSPLLANFTHSPLDPETNEKVAFDASSSTPDGSNIGQYVWNFGDGNVTSVGLPTITHHYSIQGTYNVTLTITDIDGLNNTRWKTITIEPTLAVAPTDIAPYAIAAVAVAILATLTIYLVKIRKPTDKERNTRKPPKTGLSYGQVFLTCCASTLYSYQSLTLSKSARPVEEKGGNQLE